MKKIVLVFVLLMFLGLLMSGCAPIRKYSISDYHRAEHSYQDGNIGAVLDGHFDTKGWSTQKNTPYDLTIAIQDTSATSESISYISSIKLINEHDEVVFEKKELENKFEKNSKDEYISYYLFDDLDIEYSNYKIDIEYEIINESNSISKEVSLKFEKDYYEYYSNDWWDAIMGI